jgi:hypothetical protein
MILCYFQQAASAYNTLLGSKPLLLILEGMSLSGMETQKRY